MQIHRENPLHLKTEIMFLILACVGNLVSVMCHVTKPLMSVRQRACLLHPNTGSGFMDCLYLACTVNTFQLPQSPGTYALPYYASDSII